MKRNWILGTADVMMAAGLLAGCGSSNTRAGNAAAGTTTAGTTAAGTTEQGQTTQADVITIGTEGTYSPNSYHHENGNQAGFDAEVAEKIAEKLGVRVEFVESEWESLLAGMDSGRIDIVLNEVETWEERREKYDFSEPYTYIQGAPLVAEDNDEIQSVEDLVGKRAVQNLTSSWGQLAESYGAELLGMDSMNQSVELLLTGRADVTLNAESAFYDFMKNQPDRAVKIAAMTDYTTSSVIPVRKGKESLVNAINDALDEMRESGELEELSVKYFGEDVTAE